MSKYSDELKLKIVKENENGYGRKYLSKKYGINANTIKNWIIKYKSYGEEGIKKKIRNKNYSASFKLSVLQYRKVNKTSYVETAKHFGIGNYAMLAYWQKKYDEKGFEGLSTKAGRPRTKGEGELSEKTKKTLQLKESEKEELIRLREENKYLKAHLAYQKKLEALIQKKKSKTKKRQK